MLQYRITIVSKNKNSINNFFKILFNILKKKKNIIKYLKKKRKVKVLTLLKSPHVNKTAQEQFESRLYVRQIYLNYSAKNFHVLILLKKLKIYIFNDIQFKTEFIINNFLKQKHQLQLLNPNNFKLNFFKKKTKNTNLKDKNIQTFKNICYKKDNLFTQTKYLLKIFDIYGHFLTKNQV